MVRILKHQTDKTISYFAHVTIGKLDLQLISGGTEVYRCSATGKSIFACVEAIQKMARSFTETNGITYVCGLDDNKPCPLTIWTEKEEVGIIPVTYNDMNTEPTSNRHATVARIIVWRKSENLFALITREVNGDPAFIPVSNAEVLFSALTRVGPDDEKMLRRMTVSELKRPTATRLTWFDTREVWEF